MKNRNQINIYIQNSSEKMSLAGTIGQVTVTVQSDGGHYTLVTVETNQVGESESDRLAKRFLTIVHTLEYPDHHPIGAY